ncbi:uncharacterized protein VP01_730g1, partial [Puccinia sorghi]
PPVPGPKTHTPYTSMANQPQATQSNPLISQSTHLSDLDISLHPLPILNVSDHFTRTRLQSERQDIDSKPSPYIRSPLNIERRLRTYSHAVYSPAQVFGALIGTQVGKKIEIVNSFEILTDPDGKVNDGFLKTRREQFQQVFPTLDLLGWYTNGQEPRERDLAILNQLSESTDLSSPILMFYDPLRTQSSGTTSRKELPVQIFEFTQSTGVSDGEAFVKCTFDVQTSEAERIAVDCVAKPNAGSKESGRASPPPFHTHDEILAPGVDLLRSCFLWPIVVANLITQRNAIQMLHHKLGAIVDYLVQLMASLEAEPSAPKIDHDLLREISSLVASLSNPNENLSFQKEYMIVSTLLAKIK